MIEEIDPSREPETPHMAPRREQAHTPNTVPTVGTLEGYEGREPDTFTMLHEQLDEFRKTPESFAIELRMSLSQLIIENMCRLGWSQRKLAKAVNRTEPFVSRVLHGDENCTLATAARFLHALGVRARFDSNPPALPADDG